MKLKAKYAVSSHFKKLTKSDRVALEHSVERYSAYTKLKRADLDIVDLRSDACALCVAYYLRRGTCDRCPIAEHTGSTGCEETPYYGLGSDLALNSLLHRAKADKKHLAKFRKRCEQQAAFMQRLLDNDAGKWNVK